MKSIDYGRLVATPECVLKELCAFIGVEFDFEMLRFCDSAQKYAPKDWPGGKIHDRHVGLLKNINADSLVKWKARISDDVLAVIQCSTMHRLKARGDEIEPVTIAPQQFDCPSLG